MYTPFLSIINFCMHKPPPNTKLLKFIHFINVYTRARSQLNTHFYIHIQAQTHSNAKTEKKKNVWLLLKSWCVLKVFSQAKIESVSSFGNFAKIYEFCNSNRHSHQAAFSLRSVAVDRYNSAIFVLALGLLTKKFNYNYIIRRFLF